ncbi:MAG: hypothetical protein H6696_17045 [Deferribacteres bacterium]|nr:hypothetical protein [candidate division KSB1 bacterium]MCB9503642.1 hypothetical protein [Deferribacteres bacterium]
MIHGNIATNIVFDDFGQYARLPFLISPQFKLHQLDEFSINGAPTVFIVNPQNINKSLEIFEQLPEEVRASSLITGRVEQGQKPPVEQARGTALIHHCSDKKFLTWINLVAGNEVNAIYLDWFVPLKVFPPYAYNENLLIRAFDSLPLKSANEIQRKYLEKTVHCSSFKLEYLCKQIYGMTPGRLLRIWRYFALTKKFMAEEARLGTNSRRGRSPLRTLENDYCEALIRLLKISYSDLRFAAQKEHWIAVWVAALRNEIEDYY